MAPAVNPVDREQIRAAVAARYAGLARAAQAGHAVTDCDASTFSAGCFGPAGYPDAGGLPDQFRAELRALALTPDGRHGGAAGQAGSTYSLMTVGDGEVRFLPRRVAAR